MLLSTAKPTKRRRGEGEPEPSARRHHGDIEKVQHGRVFGRVRLIGSVSTRVRSEWLGQCRNLTVE